MIAFLVAVSGSPVAAGQVDFEAGRFVLRAVVALVQNRSLSGLVSISLETFKPRSNIPRFLANSIASSKVFLSDIVPSRTSFMVLKCVSISPRRPSTSQTVKVVKFESLVRNSVLVVEQDLVGERGFLRMLVNIEPILSIATIPQCICGGVVGKGVDIP
jgi:hypothetical protein